MWMPGFLAQTNSNVSWHIYCRADILRENKTCCGQMLYCQIRLGKYPQVSIFEQIFQFWMVLLQLCIFWKKELENELIISHKQIHSINDTYIKTNNSSLVTMLCRLFWISLTQTNIWYKLSTIIVYTNECQNCAKLCKMLENWVEKWIGYMSYIS